MHKLSKFHAESIGIVVANKPLGSAVIEVLKQEDSPMVDGELSDTMTKYKSKSSDAVTKPYSIELTSTVSVKATWLPLGSSNRLTAPDVRRGESVILYKFADEDKYWWTTLKDDMKLRRLETVIYGFSASKEPHAKLDHTNMYFLEISTHKGVVHFSTSKANGEPYSYNIQINTAEGFIQIEDDNGQVFSLNSGEKRLSMVNGAGSFVDINKEDIIISSSSSITLKTKSLVQESTTNAVKAKAVTITGSGSIKITSPATSIS